MLYDISDVCRIFQMSPNGIRYYEDLGLIHPSRSEGGRRRYADEEMRMLLHIKSLRSMGIDVKRIGEMFTNQTESVTEDTVPVIDEKIADLQQEIRNLEFSIRMLEQYKRRLEQFSSERAEASPAEEPRFESVRTSPVYFLSLSPLFGRTRKEQEQLSAWISLVPAVRKMDFYEMNASSVHHRVGFAIQQSYAEERGLPLLDRAERIPSREALKAYYDFPHRDVRGFNGKDLDFFFRKDRELAGWDRIRVISSFLFGNVQSGVQQKFTEVWISEWA